MSESRRSAACANEVHARCPHLMGLRLTGADLCRCPCHASCPVSGPDAADLGHWWDACTCPGSDPQRAEGRRTWNQDRPPTMSELEQRKRKRDAELSRAMAAVQPRATGLPASAVRQLLIDQLRSQGSDVPPEDLLDFEVMRIQHPLPPLPSPGAGLFASARALASAYRQHRSVARQFRSAMTTERETLAGPHGEQPYIPSFFDPDESLPIQVTLDQQALARLARPDGTVYVSLLPQPGTGPHPVAVFIREHQVGVLPAGDGALYRPAMAVAAGKGAVLMVRGVIDTLPGDEKRLRIYAAGIQ